MQKKIRPEDVLNFNGTDDCLSIPDHDDFQFGSGDFTVEFYLPIKKGMSRLERIVMLFKAWRHRRVWEYGTFRGGSLARRNRKEGNVQFILWMPGEHTHEKPYWYDADSSWWPTFKTKDSEKVKLRR